MCGIAGYLNLTGAKYDNSTPSSKISRELRDTGVPFLVNADDPRGFHHNGEIKQYLVVSNFEEWKTPVRQADFDRLMKTWPTYGSILAGEKRR